VTARALGDDDEIGSAGTAIRVGVEITLNEADGRAGRVNVAVGALINVVRKLSLTDGNTIYMNGEVPAGQVQIKIGKKLPRE